MTAAPHAGATPAVQLHLFEIPPLVIPVTTAEVPRRPAQRTPAPAVPCSLCGYPRAFRRGVCRSCHRKLSDGGLEQLPDARTTRSLSWLSRREYLMAWRATLPPAMDRLLCEVFALPLTRPADALTRVLNPAAPEAP